MSALDRHGLLALLVQANPSVLGTAHSSLLGEKKQWSREWGEEGNLEKGSSSCCLKNRVWYETSGLVLVVVFFLHLVSTQWSGEIFCAQEVPGISVGNFRYNIFIFHAMQAEIVCVLLPW